MARSGRPETLLDCLDATTRERIHEALLSDANVFVADVYRRFGLSERGVKRRSFHAYAKRLRKRFQERRAGDEPDAPMVGSRREKLLETFDRMMEFLNAQLDAAGDPKRIPGIAAGMRVLNDSYRLVLEEAAEERAADKHESWKQEQLKKVRTRLDADSTGREQYSREDVYDLVDKAMRGEL